MSALPASAGWRWVKEGFALYRKRPGQLTFLFTSYMFVMIALGFIPVVGQLLPLFLAPTFSMVFMTACVQIEQGRQLNPLQLRAAFAPPVPRRLFTLGAFYLLAALLAVGVSYLIDGGLFMKLMMNQREAEAGQSGQSASVLVTMIVLAIAYIPAFWYAAPLIAWQNMPVGKAMFYSFFSVFRGFKIFVVYFLAWIVIGAMLPTLLAGLLAMVIGKGFAMLLMFLLTIILTVVMYCSFYSTYVDVFGKPELPQPQEPAETV